MPGRRRRAFRPTPRILLFALVDAAGMGLLAIGGAWMIHGTAVRGFPANRAEAAIAVLAGLTLMLYGAARILRELARQLQEQAE